MTDNNLWWGGVIALCVWDLMFMRCRFPLPGTCSLPGHTLCHFMTASLLSSHSRVGVQSLRFCVDCASLMFYCFSRWVMIFSNEFTTLWWCFRGEGEVNIHNFHFSWYVKLQFPLFTSGKRIKGAGGLLRNAYFTFLEIVNSKIFKEQFHLWYIMFHPKKME